MSATQPPPAAPAANRSIVRGSVLVFVTQVALFVLSIPLSALITRNLVPAIRGDYALISLVPTILALFLDPGFGNAGIYLVGQRRMTVTQAASALFSVSLVLSGLGWLVWSAINAAPSLLQWIGFATDASTRQLLWLSVLSLPFLLLSQYFAAILLSLQRMNEYNLSRVLVVLIQLGLVGLLVMLGRFDLFWAVCTFAIASMLTALLTVWLVLRQTHFRPLVRLTASDKEHARAAITYGLKGYIGRVLPFLGYRLDLFILAALMTRTDLGVYAAGVFLAEKIWTISSSIAMVLFPRVAASSGQSGVDVTAAACRHTALLISIAAVALMLIAHPVIWLLYGPAYRGAVIALIALLPGVVAISLSSVVSSYISGSGHPEAAIVPSLISVVINIGANFVLIPQLGILGAALASTLSYTVVAALLIRYFLRMTGVPLRSLLIIQPTDLALYRRLINTVVQKLSQRASRA